MFDEKIDYKATKLLTTKGNQATVVYIDPKSSDYSVIYNNKDTLKKRFGLMWFGANRYWGWIISKDPEKIEYQLTKYIRPCIEFINKLEDGGNPSETPDDKMGIISSLITKMDEVINSKVEVTEDFTSMDAEKVKQKLVEFKNALLKCTTDAEFRERFQPILQQVISGGHRYSILNTLLIHIQDPQATMVYSTKKWNMRNRYVFDTKNPICLWVPIQDPVKSAQIKKAFLSELGKKREEELTADEEEEMYKRLHSLGNIGMKLSSSFFDIRFTKVKHGKKDLVNGEKSVQMINQKNGNENGDLKWFDENSPVTDESEQIYSAIIKGIQSTGIRIEYVDDLDDARGLSCGGYIKVLGNAPKNMGTCSTLVHEFSHEIFHQMNLKNSGNKIFGSYYIGTAQGINVVEQQAELCAWIVMQFLGYDMKTNINYLGNWGINEENAAKVFDQVASASDKITKLIYDNFGKINESFMKGKRITGADVAALFGKKGIELYNKSKQIEAAALNESKEKCNSSFERICGIKIN